MASVEHKISVSESEANLRLDKIISDKIAEISRSMAAKLISGGNVVSSSCGKLMKPSYAVKESEIITVYIPEARPLDVKAENIDLNIIYEDGDLIIINKKNGMVVHPAAGHQSATLVNAVMGHCDDLSSIGGVIRPGIVHRLDKDTSGIIIIAKNDAAHNGLSDQFRDRTIKKTYYAIVCGEIKKSKFAVDLAIGRSASDRKKMAVIQSDTHKAREAFTEFELVSVRNGFSLLKAMPRTGRTHQIRVHLSHVGFPIAGDVLYTPPAMYKALARKKYFSDRLWLHAAEIEFKHPASGKILKFQTGLPDEFDIFIKNI
ncbi:MAG: Ribosomal large subunit pseudouridine synthase D [bacterium ADurb.Bin243]|nr:MAG: Ribosomal large subunit pseudouridine synthase D [bacterium ADurb.Bin243]HOD41542.1 RluA family pseudouridine synthase [Candidatus Wallbacteria bacterium]